MNFYLYLFLHTLLIRIYMSNNSYFDNKLLINDVNEMNVRLVDSVSKITILKTIKVKNMTIFSFMFNNVEFLKDLKIREEDLVNDIKHIFLELLEESKYFIFHTRQYFLDCFEKVTQEEEFNSFIVSLKHIHLTIPFKEYNKNLFDSRNKIAVSIKQENNIKNKIYVGYYCSNINCLVNFRYQCSNQSVNEYRFNAHLKEEKIEPKLKYDNIPARLKEELRKFCYKKLCDFINPHLYKNYRKDMVNVSEDGNKSYKITEYSHVYDLIENILNSGYDQKFIFRESCVCMKHKKMKEYIYNFEKDKTSRRHDAHNIFSSFLEIFNKIKMKNKKNYTTSSDNSLNPPKSNKNYFTVANHNNNSEKNTQISEKTLYYAENITINCKITKIKHFISIDMEGLIRNKIIEIIFFYVRTKDNASISHIIKYLPYTFEEDERNILLLLIKLWKKINANYVSTRMGLASIASIVTPSIFFVQYSDKYFFVNNITNFIKITEHIIRDMDFENINTEIYKECNFFE